MNDDAQAPAPRRPRVPTVLLAGCGCVTLGVVVVLVLFLIVRRSGGGGEEMRAARTDSAAPAGPVETAPLEIPPLQVDERGRPRPVELTFPISEDEQRRVLGSIDWSAPILRGGDAADVRRYLIAAARADAEVKIENALWNLNSLCREDGRLVAQCVPVREDLQRIAMARVGSPDGSVANSALLSIGGFAREGTLASDRWLPLVLQVTKHHPDPDVRRTAVGMAPDEPKDYADPRAREILLVALDDGEPAVVRYALETLALRVDEQAFLQHCRRRLTNKVAELRSHQEAGVRAWAALLTGALHEAPWQRERAGASDAPPPRPRDERRAAAAAVRPMLDDRSPVVRAAASVALGRMLDFEAAHRLAALLDDKASTIYESGEVESLTSQLGFPREVRASAATALGHFAASGGNDVCPQLAATGDTSRCIDAIRAWYEAHRAKLPAFP